MGFRLGNYLITGGAGFIGSHTVVELLNLGHEVVILDNFSNSSKEIIDRIYRITNKKPKVVIGDIKDSKKLNSIFQSFNIDAVIHFAGYKAVGDSVLRPLDYYSNNVAGSLNLFHAMQKNNVKKIVFSSSATVYGEPDALPLNENMPVKTDISPYGMTKLVVEKALEDIYKSDNSWSILILRYFNPIGAHHSGLIGENPKGIPNNLMPYIVQTALGNIEYVSVYGNDYPTHDGTGVRDYIHVLDLAYGHLLGLEKCLQCNGINTFNLGTGSGYSVLEVIKIFEKVNKVKIPFKFKDRRPGDIAMFYANPEKARKNLGWKAKYNLEQMCKDSWNWHLQNTKELTFL